MLSKYAEALFHSENTIIEEKPDSAVLLMSSILTMKHACNNDNTFSENRAKMEPREKL